MKKKLMNYKERKRIKAYHRFLTSILLFLLLLIFSLIALDSTSQNISNLDSTGLPGDHFDLKTALDIFKNSKSPEDFEKKLNTKSTFVNNMDLNKDGKTDYIKVDDKFEEDAHALVLSIDVNEKETQDIAVIEIERTSVNRARLQVVGLEEIYGKEKIIEPAEEEKEKFEDDMWDNKLEENKSESSNGPSELKTNWVEDVFVNVWYWTCVQYIFADSYVIWVSPWYWNYYPVWWNPWAPYPYYAYHQICMPYGYYYEEAEVHYTTHAHHLYLPHKKTSGFIYKQYEKPRNQYIEQKKIKSIPEDRDNNNNQKLRIDKKEEPKKKEILEEPKNKIREPKNSQEKRVKTIKPR